VGRSFEVYKEGECGRAVQAVVVFSRNPWVGVEDAASYLRSRGFDVTPADLSGFTIQVGLLVSTFRETSEVKLPDGKVIRGRICEEVEKRPVDQYVLILGNLSTGTFFAFKVAVKEGWENILSATPLLVTEERSVRSSREVAECTPTAEVLKRLNLSVSLDKLKLLGAPDEICMRMSELNVTKLAFKPVNADTVNLTVKELGLNFNALELVSNAVVAYQYSYTQSYYGGAAYSVAKVTVFVDQSSGAVLSVQDGGYCSIAIWAPLVGCCTPLHCHHIASLSGSQIFAYSFGKWLHQLPLVISAYACTDACILVNANQLNNHSRSGNTCYCGVYGSAYQCPNPNIVSQDCEAACGCYALYSSAQSCHRGAP